MTTHRRRALNPTSTDERINLLSKERCPVQNLKTSLYLSHQNSANHELTGRRLKKLQREILAGRGGVEVTALVSSGYVGFLATSGEVHDFEDLVNEFGGKS